MSEGVISLDVLAPAEGAPAEGAAGGTFPTMQGIPSSNSVRHSPSLKVRDGGHGRQLNPLDAAPKEDDHPGPEDTKDSSWTDQAAEAGQAMIDRGKSIARSTREGLKEALGNDAAEEEEAYVRGVGFRATGRMGQEQVNLFHHAS